MSSTAAVGAVLVFVLGIAWGQQRCICNYITHPQTQFCQSTYAVDGIVLDDTSVPAPGDPDMGEQNNKYIRYTVGIVEVFKGHEFLTAGDRMFIYTPKFELCAKLGLHQEDGDNDYLIAGDTSVSDSGEEFLVATNCNWLAPWNEVTPMQKEGLRGAYSECELACTHNTAATPLERPGVPDEDKFGRSECVYNPIGATRMKVPDCETEHGICRGCQWESSPAYDECYTSRRERLSNTAAAITSKKGCLMLSGKQKKKCLLKLFKSRNVQF